ncbi:hypothetical protein MHAS44199_10235 [Mycolicibacterium hassiacum DSM 44199]|nr:hypothetical protein [Mycolicibacterium hassiacum DSM 44199]
MTVQMVLWILIAAWVVGLGIGAYWEKRSGG